MGVWDELFSCYNWSMQDTKVVTRFAPSPTGFVHTGNIHTGLFAWLWARKNGGKFILRVEDTDKKREVAGAVDYLRDALHWLEIDWDEGIDVGGPKAPYTQSLRISELDIYTKYANILIENGYAYADTTTEEELDLLRKKAEEQKKPFLYRENRPSNPPKWKPGIPLRFKIKELKRTVWIDAVRGELSAGPEALDDFILIKSDGYPTYNFAHIVDDIEMGITHVTRGQEFISSTPNYIAVYEALGAAQPIYVTVPHVMGEGGRKKLGKRDGAKDVLQYMKEGYLPDAMINFLALMGWNPGTEQEIFSREELIEIFDISKIQKSGAQFNEEKLDWLNKEHMKKIPEEERNAKIKSKILGNPEISKFETANNQNLLEKICPTIFDRISKWSDIDTLISDGELTYYFTAPSLDPEKIMWKKQSKDEARENLKKVLEIFESGNADYQSSLMELAEKEGKGEVLLPTRYALSGKEKSPYPFTLLNILGINESKTRIKK